MTNKRLHKDEYVQHAPEQGQRVVRINHNSASCSGDSQSLSIWRNDDGSIGAKCYRCGLTGRSGSKPSMFKKNIETKKLQEIPKDISSEYSGMPPEVATYLSHKGVTEAIAFHYGIGWSPSADGLILPVHNELKHDGFQVKYFDRKQRYSTVHRGKRELMFSHLRNWHETCVIVEDLISAIRVSNYVDMDSFALLGSELNDQGLAQLVKNHEAFIIWLDNDNDIICKKAAKLSNRLSLFGPTRLIRDRCEPKDISDGDIENIIYR